MFSKGINGGLAACAALLIAGCGATLPVTDLEYSTDERFSRFVDSIAQHLRCEIHKAVATEFNPNVTTRRPLYNWAAKVALTIRANEKGSIGPSVSLANIPGTFLFDAGLSAGAEATREMTMTYYLPFNELIRDPKKIDFAGRNLNCDKAPAHRPIAGNLGINQSLSAALQAWDGWRTLGETLVDGPFETITHHVTFQVAAGISATPGWKLINVTASGKTELGAARTTTNELLITMGPKALGDRKQSKNVLDEQFSIERLRSVITRP